MARPKSEKTRSGTRNTISVAVYTETEAAITEARMLSGMPMTEFVARLLEFFAAQDDVIQGYMLGTMPNSIRSDVAAMLLKQEANAPPLPAELKDVLPPDLFTRAARLAAQAETPEKPTAADLITEALAIALEYAEDHEGMKSLRELVAKGPGKAMKLAAKPGQSGLDRKKPKEGK